MSASDTNYWKLGLFVVTGVALGVAAVFWVGAQRFRRETEPRVTYFNESVQGLEVGAPVKMRGVTIGTVSDITIAPDRRRVQVTAEIYVDLWVRLGLGSESELRSAGPGPEDLRVQLATTGITGVKFLQVDFFPNAAEPEKLPFVPPYNYLPSTPSTLKSIEDGITIISQELPELLATLATLGTTLIEDIEAFDLAGADARVQSLLARTESLVTRADTKLSELDVRALSGEARSALAALESTVGRADRLLERLESADGPVERVARDLTSLAARAEELVVDARSELAATDLPATGAALRGSLAEASSLGVELEEVLALMRETLLAVRALASYLEREPGALLRGRSAELPPPVRPGTGD